MTLKNISIPKFIWHRPPLIILDNSTPHIFGNLERKHF